MITDVEDEIDNLRDALLRVESSINSAMAVTLVTIHFTFFALFCLGLSALETKTSEIKKLLEKPTSQEKK